MEIKKKVMLDTPDSFMDLSCLDCYIRTWNPKWNLVNSWPRQVEFLQEVGGHALLKFRWVAPYDLVIYDIEYGMNHSSIPLEATLIMPDNIYGRMRVSEKRRRRSGLGPLFLREGEDVKLIIENLHFDPIYCDGWKYDGVEHKEGEFFRNSIWVGSPPDKKDILSYDTNWKVISGTAEVRPSLGLGHLDPLVIHSGGVERPVSMEFEPEEVPFPIVSFWLWYYAESIPQMSELRLLDADKTELFSLGFALHKVLPPKSAEERRTFRRKNKVFVNGEEIPEVRFLINSWSHFAVKPLADCSAEIYLDSVLIATIPDAIIGAEVKFIQFVCTNYNFGIDCVTVTKNFEHAMKSYILPKKHYPRQNFSFSFLTNGIENYPKPRPPTIEITPEIYDAIKKAEQPPMSAWQEINKKIDGYCKELVKKDAIREHITPFLDAHGKKWYKTGPVLIDMAKLPSLIISKRKNLVQTTTITFGGVVGLGILAKCMLDQKRIGLFKHFALSTDLLVYNKDLYAIYNSGAIKHFLEAVDHTFLRVYNWKSRGIEYPFHAYMADVRSGRTEIPGRKKFQRLSKLDFFDSMGRILDYLVDPFIASRIGTLIGYDPRMLFIHALQWKMLYRQYTTNEIIEPHQLPWNTQFSVDLHRFYRMAAKKNHYKVWPYFPLEVSDDIKVKETDGVVEWQYPRDNVELGMRANIAKVKHMAHFPTIRTIFSHHLSSYVDRYGMGGDQVPLPIANFEADAASLIRYLFGTTMRADVEKVAILVGSQKEGESMTVTGLHFPKQYVWNESNIFHLGAYRSFRSNASRKVVGYIHNHVHGSAEPSPQDYEVLKRMRMAAPTKTVDRPLGFLISGRELVVFDEDGVIPNAFVGVDRIIDITQEVNQFMHLRITKRMKTLPVSDRRKVVSLLSGFTLFACAGALLYKSRVPKVAPNPFRKIQRSRLPTRRIVPRVSPKVYKNPLKLTREEKMDALPRKFTPKVEGVQIRTKVKKGPLQIQIDERAKRLTKKVTPYDNSPAYQVLKGTVDSFKAIVDNVMKPDKMVQELIAISQESLPAIIPLMAAAGAKNLLQYEEYRKISNILEFGEVSEMWAEAANFDWAKGKDVALEEYDEHKQLVQTMITRDEIEILMPPPLIKRIEYFIEIAELCETGDTGTVYYPVILKDSKGHLADFSKDSNGKVAHSDIIMGEIKDGELTQLNLIGPWAKFWKKDGPTNYKRRIWKTVTNVSVDPNRLEIEFEGNYKSVPESAARYLYLYASIFDDTYDFSIEDMKENDIGSDSGCIYVGRAVSILERHGEHFGQINDNYFDQYLQSNQTDFEEMMNEASEEFIPDSLFESGTREACRPYILRITKDWEEVTFWEGIYIQIYGVLERRLGISICFNRLATNMDKYRINSSLDKFLQPSNTRTTEIIESKPLDDKTIYVDNLGVYKKKIYEWFSNNPIKPDEDIQSYTDRAENHHLAYFQDHIEFDLVSESWILRCCDNKLIELGLKPKTESFDYSRSPLAIVREAKGLTQQKLADKIGLSSRTIASYERGLNKPTLLVAEKIAKVLEVRVEDLDLRIKPQSPLAIVRKAKGLTQQELADKIGIHKSTIASYERGKVLPSVKVAKKIAKVLEVRVEDLNFRLTQLSKAIPLAIAREAKGLTQQELADKIGLSLSTIVSYENGKWFPPVDVAKKIAKILKVRVEDL